MAMMGDTLKYDTVDFQNLEAKLQNELRAGAGMEQTRQTTFNVYPFLSAIWEYLISEV